MIIKIRMWRLEFEGIRAEGILFGLMGYCKQKDNTSMEVRPKLKRLSRNKKELI